MRPISPYMFALSTLLSVFFTACGEEDKPSDTATVEVDTADTEDPVETGDAPDDTGDTSDTGSIDSGDTADTEPVDTGDTDTGVVDTGSSEPGANAVPDFLLADINPNSSTVGQNISPRDYLQQISGWYFIKAT